MIYGEVADIQS